MAKMINTKRTMKVVRPGHHGKPRPKGGWVWCDDEDESTYRTRAENDRKTHQSPMIRFQLEKEEG